MFLYLLSDGFILPFFFLMSGDVIQVHLCVLFVCLLGVCCCVVRSGTCGVLTAVRNTSLPTMSLSLPSTGTLMTRTGWPLLAETRWSRQDDCCLHSFCTSSVLLSVTAVELQRARSMIKLNAIQFSLSSWRRTINNSFKWEEDLQLHEEWCEFRSSREWSE